MDLDKLDEELQQDVDPSKIFKLAVSLGAAKQFEEAIKMYDVYLLLNPWSEDGLNNKADCLLALGRLDEARAYVTRALMVNPLYPFTWCTLGEIQVKMNEYFGAKLSFKRSLALAGPDHVSYPITLRLLQELEAAKPTI